MVVCMIQSCHVSAAWCISVSIEIQRELIYITHTHVPRRLEIEYIMHDADGPEMNLKVQFSSRFTFIYSALNSFFP